MVVDLTHSYISYLYIFFVLQYGRPPPGSSELMRQTGGQWTMASNRGPGAIYPDGVGQHGGGGGGMGVNAGGSSSNQNQEYYKARDQQSGASLSWASQQGGAAGGGGSGGVGGSWANTANNNTSVASRSRDDPGRPSVTINDNYGHGGSNSGGGGGTAVSDGTYEKNLILELCPAGGMKAVPPPDKLANFKRAAPSLNPDLICPVLLDCIEDGQPWIIRAKALCVMEACIQAGNGTENNPYANFFHACHEEIAPLANHARAAVKEPAQRVLQLLGVFDAAGAAGASGAAQARHTATAPAPAAPNLLDFDDAPSQASSGGGSGGGQPPAPPPNQPPPPPPPVDAVPSSGGGGGGGGSMFGGMQVKSKTPYGATMVAAAPTPEAAPTSGNLLDFMSDDAVAAAAPAPAATTNGTSNDSMFAQLNMQDKKAADSQDAGDLSTTMSNGSSAFSFMNQNTAQSNDSTNNTAAEQQPPPPVPPQQAQSSQSFDPLMNLTPNSEAQQRKTMQMSPEQMQAMAYQQMRMQQQQHMQHMQMAYMHQQQGGGRPAPGGGPPMPPIYQGGGGGVPGGAGIMGSNLGGAASSGFSFMDAHPVKKDDKKFDFVKDAMQSANKK
jgi:hypothetical protein